MARNESDREDLYAEFASALARWELNVPFQNLPIVAAIRKDGRLSIYLTPDRCYHFSSQGGLMRAFVDGFLYRTQGNTLARLRRFRSETESELLRHDLRKLELTQFGLETLASLQPVAASLADGQVTVLRSEGNMTELAIRLASICRKPLVLAPAFPTRKD
ncbi:MAG: hypothetical protein KDA80_10640 [Planctomycetaceae bacterium]|nr:hypothetical protein [Planctomycetaceae bacterium]